MAQHKTTMTNNYLVITVWYTCPGQDVAKNLGSSVILRSPSSVKQFLKIPQILLALLTTLAHSIFLSVLSETCLKEIP